MQVSIIKFGRQYRLIKSKHKFSFLIPSIADFLFLAIFLLICLYAGKDLLNDGDTGYHIRAGEYILNTLSFPRYDMFSYLSPPLPWTAHEWLSEIIMAVVHRSFGMTGLVIFFAFLISFAFFLLFKIIRSNNSNIVTTISIVIFAAAASQMHWLARPHIFSMILMIVWYYILDLYHYQDRNYLYLFPFIMIVWVNLHGGFMGGFMLIGIYLLGSFAGYLFPKGNDKEIHLQRCKTLALTTIACLAVALVNPYGFHILLFPFKLTAAKFLMDNVSEFASPNFHASYVKSFEFLLLFTIALIGRSRLRLNIIETVLLLLFTHMSLYSARYIPLFAIIAAPIMVRQLQTIEEQSSGKFAAFMRKRATNIAAIDASATGYFWPLVSVLVVISLAFSGAIEFKFDEKIKPVAAVEFLKKEKIPGHMFNNDEFGDYIIYSAHNQYKVFIDGRLDMYGVNNLKEYRNVTNFKQGWEEVLVKYSISWIIYPADSEFSRFLLMHPEWKLIYADKVANIFVKKIPANQYLIDKYPSVKPVVIEDKEDAAK
jgi:hypothetical protein